MPAIPANNGPVNNQPSSSSSFSTNIINYVTFVILILMIGTQAYNLWQSRNESFVGVWIIRACVVLLIVSFVATFIISAFVHRFTMDKLPSCTSIQYFRFRWYVFVTAALSLAAIPVYLAVLKRSDNNLLMILLASQIQINLFTVLLTIVFDSVSRYFYQKQVENSNQQHPPHQQQQQSFAQSPSVQNPQFGYFSPKTKGPAPLASQKNPFDSGNFRYAR